MGLDSSCGKCLKGAMLEVDLETIDIDALPDDVNAEALTRMQTCNKCGFVVFHISECAECNNEYECSGKGIANSNLN